MWVRCEIKEEQGAEVYWGAASMWRRRASTRHRPGANSGRSRAALVGFRRRTSWLEGAATTQLWRDSLNHARLIFFEEAVAKVARRSGDFGEVGPLPGDEPTATRLFGGGRGKIDDEHVVGEKGAEAGPDDHDAVAACFAFGSIPEKTDGLLVQLAGRAPQGAVVVSHTAAKVAPRVRGLEAGPGRLLVEATTKGGPPRDEDPDGLGGVEVAKIQRRGPLDRPVTVNGPYLEQPCKAVAGVGVQQVAAPASRPRSFVRHKKLFFTVER